MQTSELEKIQSNIVNALKDAFKNEYAELSALITRDTAISFEEACNINTPVIFVGRGELQAGETNQVEAELKTTIEIILAVKVGKDNTTSLQTVFNNTENLIVETLCGLTYSEVLRTGCKNFSLTFSSERNLFFEEEFAISTLIFNLVYFR